jgi:hypothetical protein
MRFSNGKCGRMISRGAAAMGWVLLATISASNAQESGWSSCGLEPHAGICLAVTCSPQREPDLYAAGIAPEIRDLALSVGGSTYPLSPSPAIPSAEPYKLRLGTAQRTSMLDALKRNYSATLQLPGANVEIPLDGSFEAISAVMATCTPHPPEYYKGWLVCGASCRGGGD